MSNRLQRKLLEKASPDAVISTYRSEEWQSPTFKGHMHYLTVKFIDLNAAVEFVGQVELNGEEWFTLPEVLLLELKVTGSKVLQPIGHMEVYVEAKTLDQK